MQIAKVRGRGGGVGGRGGEARLAAIERAKLNPKEEKISGTDFNFKVISETRLFKLVATAGHAHGGRA